MTDDPMTKIGIDEQIARVEYHIDRLKNEDELVAVIASLRELKRIKCGLQEMIAGDPHGGTYSGSQCVEIATALLSKEVQDGK
jgi:hypothetical protein